MAAPWTFEQRLAAYRAEGIKKIVIMPGAKTHNRDAATGKTFGPVYGVAIHHTAADWDSDEDGAQFCYRGTSSLPGPLCHDYVGEDGTLYVIGHGRTNHAGTTTQAVKASLLAGRTPNLNDRLVGDENVDANDFMFGLEIENRGDGKDPYEPAQYDTAVRWAAAHIRYYGADGWDENNAWGHKEITKRKIDPSFSTPQFRADVRARLEGSQEEDVALSAEDIKKVAQAVVEELTGTTEGRQKLVGAIFRTDGVVDSPDAAADPTGNAYWWAQSYLREGYLAQRAQGAALAEVKAKVDSLAVGGINLDELANKVADVLHERLSS
jgi:hypothetical protein